ncbi:hypothetical protein PoB_001238200 [Plakobranchus ocellatus]|uniref:Uncharacterized protein n=1 Tax=Plakobranchus ocellatus TaxID=259542 RepID=A0AAV3YSG0_9GAST|nr:hypothetical protein PoB_001238200 [Plakobranchus ocellatus]
MQHYRNGNLVATRLFLLAVTSFELRRHYSSHDGNIYVHLGSSLTKFTARDHVAVSCTGEIPPGGMLCLLLAMQHQRLNLGCWKPDSPSQRLHNFKRENSYIADRATGLCHRESTLKADVQVNLKYNASTLKCCRMNFKDGWGKVRPKKCSKSTDELKISCTFSTLK